jgi:hypothetical protein
MTANPRDTRGYATLAEYLRRAHESGFGPPLRPGIPAGAADRGGSDRGDRAAADRSGVVMIRRLLILYPRAWRDRYGAEVADLADELIRTGETTPARTGLDLLAGAAIAWWQVLARWGALALAGAVIAIGGGVAV